MIVIKEEFVGGEKWRRVVKLGGAPAIVMWLALKCYASQHPSSEGFVPDEDVDDLPGAPRPARKALRALVDCGRLLPAGERGPGLVEPAAGGWRLHDYLDHSVAPEETELRRQRARLKKQRQRDDQRRELEALLAHERDMSRGQPGDRPGDMPMDFAPPVPGTAPEPVTEDSPAPVPGPTLLGARPPAHPPGPAPTRAGARPHPNPPHPNPNQNSGSGRARGPAGAGDPGTRGYLRVEPQAEHFTYAKEHAVNLEEAVRKLNADPRTRSLDTMEAWAVLTRMLEKAAAGSSRLGGAA